MPLVNYIPETFHFRFMEHRHWSFPFSAVITILSVLAFVTLGLNAGVDFRGGTLIEVQSTAGPANIGSVRDTITRLNVGEVQIQEFGSNTELLIRIGSAAQGGDAGAEVVERVRTALGSAFTIRRVEVVGPSVSSELVQQSILAVVLGLAMIWIYLWFRFEWQFAVGALVTTLHDLLLVLGLYSILQLEFDLTSIAAILTIMGYSLNDTVVIYDRIRELMRRYKRMPTAELLDMALNATVSRTIIVAATTFFATTALYIFGGEVLRGFSLAMLFGVVVGTHSTIFIAAPILLYLGIRGAHEPAEVPREPAVKAARALSS
ncbi:MAG TPA: protein translocase subunit SecF [Beijerinckiaceae bacterium]